MTNKKDGKENIFDYENVAVEAALLVNDVLEEATIIVTTASGTNDPWKYISCLKKYKCQDDAYNNNLTFIINKDCLKNIKLESSFSTSTPQKGQGDEVKQLSENNTVNSTSLYISQLFDMTELETAEDEENIEDIKESKVSFIDDITKIIEHCVDVSVCKVSPTEDVNDCKELLESCDELSNLNLSEIVNEVTEIKKSNDEKETNINDTIETYVDAKDGKANQNIRLEELCSYEHAYLSLNRDYEQDFEISELKLQDPRKLSLQEIDLTPEQDVAVVNKDTLEEPTSSKNANLVSGKHTLIHRCRVQSRKLLARLRSWFWRRSLRKYKVARGWTRSDRGMSPLSPSAKRRAASLLDQWQIRGTFSSSSWKFNTISGAFVNSALWKELGSKVQFKRSY